MEIPLIPSTQPIGDNLQVRKLDDMTHVGAIILPDSQKPPPFLECEVVACGPACRQCKPGDIILLSLGALLTVKVRRMTEEKISHVEYLFSKEDKILAVLPRG